MNREICGQCGQSLDPGWIDERIPKLESKVMALLAERDSMIRAIAEMIGHQSGDLVDLLVALSERLDRGDAAQQERDALRALLRDALTKVSAEIQASWYEADTFAEAQRGARHCKQIVDAALYADAMLAARALEPPA